MLSFIHWDTYETVQYQVLCHSEATMNINTPKQTGNFHQGVSKKKHLSILVSFGIVPIAVTKSLDR